MKKIILSLILVFSLCLCFTSCEEKEDIFKERNSEGIVVIDESDKADTDTSEEPQNDLYKAYKHSIETFTSDATYDTQYSLFDIDANGTPELIYNVEQGKYKIYSYDGTIFIYSGGFNSKSGVFLYDGMLFATTGNAEYDVHAKISLDENLKIYDIGYPYMTRESVAPGSTESTYTYNKEKITKDEYDAICNDMAELKTYPLSDLSYLKTFFEEE